MTVMINSSLGEKVYTEPFPNEDKKGYQTVIEWYVDLYLNESKYYSFEPLKLIINYKQKIYEIEAMRKTKYQLSNIREIEQ